MANFSKEELLHIAQLSALKLEDQEIPLFVDQINTILSYVDQLQTVVATNEVVQTGNCNIFREDIAIKKDSLAILAQAPTADDGYFAVPKILDEK